MENIQNKSEETVKGQELNINKESIKGKVGLDIENFAGEKTKIARVFFKGWDMGNAEKERFAMVIESNPIKVNDVEFTAREYLNCWRADEKGTPVKKDTVFNFSLTPNSNASKMMRNFNVAHPLEVEGKDVLIVRKVLDNGTVRLGMALGF